MTLFRLRRAWWLAAMCAVLLPIAALAAAPDNDNFANRRVLVGTAAQDVVDNTGATIEPGEPVDTNCVGKSVWWSWTAPAAGTLNIRTHAYFSAWSGNLLTNLTLLASKCSAPCVYCVGLNWPDGPPPVPLDVYEGETVQILAASLPWNISQIQLTLDFTTVRVLDPTNGASVIEGSSVAIRLAPDEQAINGTNSPPVVTIRSLSFFQLLPVAEPDSLTVVVSNLPPDEYTVFAQLTNGANRLVTTTSHHFHVRPVNDDFGHATELSNLPSQSSLCFRSATAEPGEPLVPGQGPPASLWWKWAAAQSGELWVTAPVAVLGVFTGEQLGALTLKTNGTGSMAIQVDAGTTYYVKAALPPPGLERCFSGSPFDLIQFALRPANDDFENRKMLVGGMVAESGDLSVATIEPGEPPNIGTKTAWWSWKAPASGLVSIYLDPPGNIVQAAVWQGNSLTNLSLVTDREMAFGFLLHFYQFEVHEGETYEISVGNGYGIGTTFSFSLDLCSMRISEPAEDTELIGPTNLRVRLTPPQSDVEGEISHLTFRATTTATRSCCSIFTVEPLSSDPLTGLFTNLPPNEYWIYAQMTNGAGRLITTLTNRVRIRPPNDDFDAATEITTLPFSTAYQLASASDELEEPVVSSRSISGSVWWRWTAPRTGVVVAQGNGPVGAFIGDRLDKLKPVGFVPAVQLYEDVLRLQAKAGKTYYFKVSPWIYLGQWKSGLEGTFTLTEAWFNDDFENRTALMGDDLTIIVPNVHASYEPDEPVPDILPWKLGSLWWTWTAPKDGLFVLQLAEDSIGGPLVEVFSGHKLRELFKIESGDPVFWNPLRVTSGETLQLALNAGLALTNAVFRLRFLADPAPGNIGRPFQHGHGNQFFFQAGAEPGARLTVETSSDLINWTNYLRLGPSQTNSILIGPVDFNKSAQFFRTRRE